MTEDLKTSGTAIQDMLDAVDIDQQLMHLKKDILSTKSASKRDIMVRQIKYLAGLKKNGGKPADSFVLHNIPVIPPMARPPTPCWRRTSATYKPAQWRLLKGRSRSRPASRLLHSPSHLARTF